ncbi:MAG: RluA family pseudouridine synthase [Elusimicrobia bacterium]|nr:RluA family pseudouridine synthase [Elusimicrobiota bacterium]
MSFIEVRFSVTDVPGAAGGRLDRFLAARIKGSTRSDAQRLLDEGRVSVAGRPGVPRAATRVGTADTVVVLYPKREDPPPVVERLSVLYEDEFLLAVDKPARMLSHPTDKVARNSVTEVLAAQFPGLEPRLAHRLDRETSGVLLLTKDAVSARLVQEQFERRETAKEYLALVSGSPAWRETTLDLPLAKAGGGIKVRQAALEDGAPAWTDFLVLASSETAALVLCKPRTGRLHQIRVHLMHLGHPILGDILYGGDGSLYLKAVAGSITAEDRAAAGAPRQMLHARALSFAHPRGGAPLTVTAEAPRDMRECARARGLLV